MTKNPKLQLCSNILFWINQPTTKNSASKGTWSRHRCNFGFFSLSSPQNRVLINKSRNFQDRCLMGYRCAPGVTILIELFVHILHLFNVKTGSINSAIYSNLNAFDREFNYTPLHSARILKLGFVCAINELLISFVY